MLCRRHISACSRQLIEFGLQAKPSNLYVGFVTLAARRGYDGYGYRRIYNYNLIIGGFIIIFLGAAINPLMWTILAQGFKLVLLLITTPRVSLRNSNTPAMLTSARSLGFDFLCSGSMFRIAKIKCLVKIAIKI